MFLERKIKELQGLKKEVPNVARGIVLESKKKVLDLIRINQLFDKGIDGKGRKLKKYKPFTVIVKKSQGKNPNIVTLNDTGDFYRGFDLIVTDKNSVGVFSKDSKTSELVSKYGGDIFTFTIDNNKVLNEEIVLKKLIEWLFSTKTFTQI